MSVCTSVPLDLLKYPVDFDVLVMTNNVMGLDVQWAKLGRSATLIYGSIVKYIHFLLETTQQHKILNICQLPRAFKNMWVLIEIKIK